MSSASNLAASLFSLHKHNEAQNLLEATLEARQRVLGATHPLSLHSASLLDQMRSHICAQAATSTVGRGALRRKERATAVPPSPTAWAEAEVRASAAEAELLEMLELEEAAAARPAGSGAKGKPGPKGKANTRRGR